MALLSLGESETGRRATDELAGGFKQDREIHLVDFDQGMAAARGAGYNGSLNLTLEEARSLGAAIGCDFYLLGDAQTIRRSAFDRPIYYEAYASVFIVNSRTGWLVKWDRPRIEDAQPSAAEHLLLEELERRGPTYLDAIKLAARDDHARVLSNSAHTTVTFEEAPEDEKAAAEKGIRLPQPYRRLRPEYPRSAAEADAEGTVDVEVDIDIDGEVSDVEVVRWAGFGLDDAAIKTIRQLHFRPAMRKGNPIPMRVLLRYNFRKPPKPDERGRSQTL